MKIILTEIIYPFLKKKKIKFLFYFLLVVVTYILSSIIIPKTLSKIINEKINVNLIYLILFLYTLYCSIDYLKNIIQNNLLIKISSYIRNEYIFKIMSKLTKNYKELPEITLYYHTVTSYWSSRLLIRYIFEYFIPYILTLILILIYFYIKLPIISYVLVFHSLILYLYIYLKIKKLIILSEDQEKKYEKCASNYSDKMKNLLNIIFDDTMNEDFKEMKYHQYKQDIAAINFYKYSNFTTYIGLMIIYSLMITVLTLLYFKNKKFHKYLITEVLFIIIIYLGIIKTFFIETLYFSCHISKLIRADKFIEKDNNLDKCNKIKTIYGINFKNVYFKYKNTYILKNLNLKFEPKKINILMGKSGSGKTTIMKLITKLIYPNKGNIYLDNYNIKNVCKTDIINTIYYVNQRTILFDKTVICNLKFGNSKSEDYIIKLLKKYKLLEYYSTLEKGIHTNCGVNGSNLSLGMQKIIMNIRGILKENKTILIFDEPLTSLDKITRVKVSNMIKKESKGKTVIIISHDTEILKYADNIINLNLLN